jgi:hypothetical protein
MKLVFYERQQPCGLYLPHGAFCGIFHLVLGG